MLLYIIRHGDPIYDPDSLTKLGELQAAALAKRLAVYGLDEIYASPLKRAQQTAQPTCDILKKEFSVEEWTSESLAWQDFCTRNEESNGWVFYKRKARMRSQEVSSLGAEWYKASVFDDTFAERGAKRILDASDEFLSRMGYDHDRENCCYKAREHSDKRVAVFCHQGFGITWLGTLLDIPLPVFWTTFDYTHTGMTVVKFQPDADGNTVPTVLTLSNDSHLFREGLPLRYNNSIEF